jgi:tetratricopeptide (TPR) repeat protein
MMVRIILLLSLPLVFGGSLAEELLRRGNAAYGRGDYNHAVADYAEAEDRITDPGLAAFNKAAALYQKGLYRDAELSYRCCLEDAVGSRRTFALYGLGTALVQQGPQRGANVMREAIRCYEECLRQSGISAELADDARHNIELAKLLILLIPPRTSDKPESRPEDDQEKPRETPDPRQTPDAGMKPLAPGTAAANTDKQRLRRDQAKDAQQTDEGSPGAGTLPPVPDQEELAPMSPEDAKEHLKRAALRILSEHRAHQKQKRVRGNDENGWDW